MDIVNCLEKMGDFIINTSQSVIGAKSVRFRLFAAEKMIILAQ